MSENQFTTLPLLLHALWACPCSTQVLVLELMQLLCTVANRNLLSALCSSECSSSLIPWSSVSSTKLPSVRVYDLLVYYLNWPLHTSPFCTWHVLTTDHNQYPPVSYASSAVSNMHDTMGSLKSGPDTGVPMHVYGVWWHPKLVNLLHIWANSSSSMQVQS